MSGSKFFQTTSSNEVTSSTVRAKMQARREHEKALAEDPTVFDYDNVYEDLQAMKNEKITEIKAADKERKVRLAFFFIVQDTVHVRVQIQGINSVVEFALDSRAW